MDLQELYELEARLDAFEWKLDQITEDVRQIRTNVTELLAQVAKLDERVPPKPKTAVTATIAGALATAAMLVIDYVMKLAGR
jgi:cell division septum initiation protein DivIVA